MFQHLVTPRISRSRRLEAAPSAINGLTSRVRNGLDCCNPKRQRGTAALQDDASTFGCVPTLGRLMALIPDLTPSTNLPSSVALKWPGLTNPHTKALFNRRSGESNERRIRQSVPQVASQPIDQVILAAVSLIGNHDDVPAVAERKHPFALVRRSPRFPPCIWPTQY